MVGALSMPSTGSRGERKWDEICALAICIHNLQNNNCDADFAIGEEAAEAAFAFRHNR